jgi:hypothetical protein
MFEYDLAFFLVVELELEYQSFSSLCFVAAVCAKLVNWVLKDCIKALEHPFKTQSSAIGFNDSDSTICQIR